MLYQWCTHHFEGRRRVSELYILSILSGFCVRTKWALCWECPVPSVTHLEAGLHAIMSS